jgi:hypothetical protein
MRILGYLGIGFVVIPSQRLETAHRRSQGVSLRRNPASEERVAAPNRAGLGGRCIELSRPIRVSGCRTYLLVPQKRVQANWSWTGEYKIEEYEAKKNGKIATVYTRKEAPRRVNHEIAHGHFA